MTQPHDPLIRPRLGFGAWATIIAGLLIAVTILTAIAVVALGVFLFLLTFIVVLALLYYFFPSQFRPRRYRRSRSVTIIDGEFHVVNPAEPERQRLEEGP